MYKIVSQFREDLEHGRVSEKGQFRQLFQLLMKFAEQRAFSAPPLQSTSTSKVENETSTFESKFVPESSGVYRDVVSDAPLFYDAQFAFEARNVAPCPDGLTRQPKAFVVGNEIWCYNPKAHRMEFFSPELESWIEHKRHRLPVPLRLFTPREFKAQREKDMENLRQIIQNMGESEALKASAEELEKNAQELTRRLRDPEMRAALMKRDEAIGLILKPFSDYFYIQVEQLSEKHFVMWEREYEDYFGAFHIFDTSLIDSEKIEFPLIEKRALEFVRLFTAKGLIIIQVPGDQRKRALSKSLEDFEPESVFKYYSEQTINFGDSTSLLVLNIKSKQWEVLNLNMTMPIAEKIVKSTDEKFVYFLTEEDIFVLDTTTWKLDKLLVSGKPQIAVDGASYSYIEDDSIRAIFSSGEARMVKVKRTKVMKESSIKDDPLWKKYFGGFGIGTMKGRKQQASDALKDAPMTDVSLHTRPYCSERDLILDLNKNRWVISSYIDDPPVVPPTAYASFVSFKGKIYLFGGENNSTSGKSRVYVLERKDLREFVAPLIEKNAEETVEGKKENSDEKNSDNVSK